VALALWRNGPPCKWSGVEWRTSSTKPEVQTYRNVARGGPNDSYLIIDYLPCLLFSISEGTLPWQPIIGAQSANSAYSPSFVTLAFRNGFKYRNVDGRVNSGNDLATSFENLMNFGPASQEFTRVVGVHPSSISTGVDLATFAWRRHS